MELTPSLVLAMWTCGIAAGAALVGWWRVVGTGYLWLAGSIVVVFSVLTGLAGGGTPAYAAAALAVFATIGAHFRIGSTILFAAAAIMNGVVGAMDSPVMAVISGSLLLGAITSEMLLGHWFLVDPRLPRWSLVRLDMFAMAGLVLEGVMVAITGSFVVTGDEGVFGLAYVVLAVFTGLLMVGVWMSLREPRYSGVMAATGLSYLAVLTSFGVVTVGRILVTGGIS
jgi:hypothetical protein